MLLVVLFLFAQLHMCSDFAKGPVSPHLCPVCSDATSIAWTPTPSISLALETNRVEAFSSFRFVPAVFASHPSSRAPPAL
jgi:hypothetical protein